MLLVSIAGVPNLTTIYIYDHPRLISTKVSSTGMLSLIVTKDSLLIGMEQMVGLSTSLEEIAISECDSLDCFQLDLFPKIERLDVANCLSLESVCTREEPLADFTSLRYLSITDCPAFFTFPDGGLAAPNLTSLELRGCINLISLPESMHSLLPSFENLKLVSLSELDSFPRSGLPSKLKSLCINCCSKLIDSRMLWDLQSLPSLSTFSIEDYEDMESFPEEAVLLPSTLTSLAIRSLWNLKSLNYKGFQHLTSLRELKIKNCYFLRSLPEEGLPSSLSSLQIRAVKLKHIIIGSLVNHAAVVVKKELDLMCYDLLYDMLSSLIGLQRHTLQRAIVCSLQNGNCLICERFTAKTLVRYAISSYPDITSLVNGSFY
ncbi:unnamed protein product [Dovyalis caffra]|uniref:Uncharacterized protein n=1 Tax=Dovyalis caffra TaxID=77055 RepID=A0AAV1RMR6_9ROSI|nr:unnamed protein product [Dovyalis caffra]